MGIVVIKDLREFEAKRDGAVKGIIQYGYQDVLDKAFSDKAYEFLCNQAMYLKAAGYEIDAVCAEYTKVGKVAWAFKTLTELKKFQTMLEAKRDIINGKQTA